MSQSFAAPGSANTAEDPSQLALPWILKLRYGLALTELAIVACAAFVLHARVPILAASVVIVLTALSNRVQHWVRTTFNIAFDKLVAGLFCFDILSLSAILLLTGGASNPFSLLYLVQITLSATILSKRWTWLLGMLAVVCFGFLFYVYLPIPALEQHHSEEARNLHLIGMWIGFAIAALLITVFSGKISEVLRQREAQLLILQQQLSNKERLASLATLAAGAAHELSTPLGTIAVIAKELEHYAVDIDPHGAIAEDSRLIRSEVERCRYILQGMSAQGAELPGELPVRIRSDALLARLKDRLPFALRERLVVENANPQDEMHVPVQGLIQALAALLKNALDASEHGPIWLAIETRGDQLQIVVRDAGTGMRKEVLEHVGEPFFTTKAPGKGMGLGTFLVRTLAERCGGTLAYKSECGQGTEAVLTIPCLLDHYVRTAV